MRRRDAAAPHCPPGALGYRRRHRYFFRVYVFGLLLLVVVAGAVHAVGSVGGRAPVWRDYPERLSAWLSRDGGAVLDHPDALARDVERERALTLTKVTVYRLDGSLLVSNVAPPLAPLAAEAQRQLEKGPVHFPREWKMALPIGPPGAPRAYAVVEQAWQPSIWRGVASIAVVLLVIALLSLGPARAMTRPLERLTLTARALGEGDLGARSGIRGPGEVGELAKAFDEMAERLQRLVRGEKELLANVSHELRTPLARIKVALEIAAEGDLETARRYLGEINSDLAELERLVADVMTAARLDLQSGRAGDAAPPLRKERVEGRELVERAAERFRAAHPSRTLSVSVAPGAPPVEADAALLRRVIDNLLDNARKYSDEGTPVELSARGDGGALVVEVRDRGIGIGADDLSRLFTPFFRTDRSRQRGTGGVGLGLALAKRIVEAHGGAIEAESTPGAGTTMRVRVPAAEPPPAS